MSLDKHLREVLHTQKNNTTIDVRKFPDKEISSLIEEKIDFGTTRYVYSVKGFPTLVIKEVIDMYPATNIIEKLVWNAAKSDFRDFFAAIYGISDTGRYIIMERLTELDGSQLAKLEGRMLYWVSDNKPSNWGVDYRGQIKMLDYASLKLGELIRPPINFSP